ncbi:hypothetical protein P2318_18480 [Myxococcaceae bacterium GXIMD 01537]
MRTVLFVTALLLGACATTPAPAPPPAPSLTYRFEGIELFGSRRYPKEELLAPYLAAVPPPGTMLDMGRDGDAFIQALAKGKETLLARYGFALVRNSVSAYAADQTLRVTVDVVDAGDEWRMRYGPAPTGSVAEPEGLLTAWSAYHARMWALVNAKEISTQDVSPCRALHCFYGPGHPELMKLEEPLLSGVPKHFAVLAEMLHTDRDASKRAQAAYLLAYGPSREAVAAALVPAMNDPEEAPRNAAMRVLWVLQDHADRPVVPLDAVLRGLQGPLISDRNKAGGLLAALVKKDASQRARILREAGEVLLEMAGARQVIERQPALDVLRTLAGKDLGEDPAAWRAWVGDLLASSARTP